MLPSRSLTIVSAALLSLVACVDPADPSGPREPHSAHDTSGKADELGLARVSSCASDAELVALAAQYIDRFVIPGTGIVRRDSSGGHVDRSHDLDGDGIAELVIYTDAEYEDTAWNISERGIVVAAPWVASFPCTTSIVGLFLGVNLGPVEDSEDVGTGGFIGVDVERGGPWCQFDTYRVDRTGWYDFVTTRDGCEPDDI